MNFGKITCSIAMAMFLTACASTDKAETEAAVQYSGFLSNYSDLKDHEVSDDSVVKRYISDEIKSGNYNKLSIDPVIYFPETKPNENISQEILNDVAAYTTNILVDSATKADAYTEQGDAQTLHFKAAITELSIVDKKLSALQYIPIAFVVTAASGKLNDMTVKFTLEIEIEDANGKSLGRIMKTGFGEALDNKEAKLTMNEIQPLLDNWQGTMDGLLQATVKK